MNQSPECRNLRFMLHNGAQAICSDSCVEKWISLSLLGVRNEARMSALAFAVYDIFSALD